MRGVALTVLAMGAAILLARYMQDVLIPFVLAGLVFYALDRWSIVFSGCTFPGRWVPDSPSRWSSAPPLPRRSACRMMR